MQILTRKMFRVIFNANEKQHYALYKEKKKEEVTHRSRGRSARNLAKMKDKMHSRNNNKNYKCNNNNTI